jgi:hypothetical protein
MENVSWIGDECVGHKCIDMTVARPNIEKCKKPAVP